VRAASSERAVKCAVITPIGPGDELYALDAEDSVKRASAAVRGPFMEIDFIKVDDRLGKMGPAVARNRGVELAQRAGAEWIFFLDARDVLDVGAFKNVAASLQGHDAIWGVIHELGDDESSGVPRPNQLLEISRIDEVLANIPVNTLQIGHFVKTPVAVATPFDPARGAAAEFDYFLRLWSRYRCIKIAQPFYYERRGADAASRGVERDTAVERLICDKCTELDFRAEFTYRSEVFRFCVVNPFDLIHGSLLKGRFFELGELSFVEEWVGPDATIVEVGAYVGNHVVYYSRFMRPRNIILLEPNPEAIVLLRRNLAANGVTVADVSRLGIGAAAAADNYDLVCEGGANRGATRLVRAAAGAVTSAPLDDLLESKVDFIKIDVEGMELEVLAGASRVIAESRPKILIEVFRPQIPRFNEWLAQHRYGVRRQFDYVHAVNYLIEPVDG
jgi:FkbM family methyltransferase